MAILLLFEWIFLHDFNKLKLLFFVLLTKKVGSQFANCNFKEIFDNEGKKISIIESTNEKHPQL